MKTYIITLGLCAVISLQLTAGGCYPPEECGNPWDIQHRGHLHEAEQAIKKAIQSHQRAMEAR